MIFGTSQYWATDSLQWKLDAEREPRPKWDPTAEQRMSENEAIFRKPVVLQEELDRERESH